VLTKFISIILICLFWLAIAGIDGIKHYPILSVVSIVFAIMLSLKINALPKKYFNPLKFLKYFFWLAKEIISSSWQVTKIIWNPKLIISPEIVEIESGFKADSAELVVLANSITLTPGTYTVNTSGSKLLVHGLTNGFIKDLRSGEMQKRVKGLV